MSAEGKGFLKVFATGCLWGTIGLFVKLMEGQGSSSSYTSFLRLLFGFAALAVLTLVLEGPKAFRIGRKTLLSCALLGIVCQGIFNLFYSRSISMNGMSVGSVLLYTAPVFTSITSMLLFHERLNAWKWLALLINVAGCALTATGGDFSGAAVSAAGILIGVGAGFTYSLTAVFGRIAMEEKASPLAVGAYNLLFGAIFVALMGRPWLTVSHPLDLRLLFLGLLFGMIPTALAYGLYFSGLQVITHTSRVPVVASVELAAAAVIGAAVFSEGITPVKTAGILLVLLSILLFSRE